MRDRWRWVDWLFGIAIAVLAVMVIVGFWEDSRDGKLLANVPLDEVTIIPLAVTATAPPVINPTATPLPVQDLAAVSQPTITPYTPPPTFTPIVPSAPVVFMQEGPAPTWTPAPVQPPPQDPNSFGEGMQIVNTDIRPGTYRAEGSDYCYWKRLSGFSGEGSDIITNDIATGATVVTIAASDAGFDSNGCGTWTRIGD